MAFTGQTFTFQAVLTAAEMNQMDANIDEVRTFHKGSTSPAEKTPGVMWIDDSSSPWLVKWYDTTNAFVPFCYIDNSNNWIRHDREMMVMNFREPIQYVNSGGAVRTLIGQEVSGTNHTQLSSAFDFEFINENGQPLMTVVTSDSSDTGQILSPNGTESAPGVSFLGDDQNGMYLPSNDKIAWSTQASERMRLDTGALMLGKSSADIGSIGTAITHQSASHIGRISTTVSSNHGLEINRRDADGPLVIFYRDEVEVGGIAVSGGLVSFDTGTLTRPTQLSPTHITPGPIPRGTVMAIIDDPIDIAGKYEDFPFMRSQISDSVGEKAIYGVYAYSDADSDNESFHVAFTGDYVCRVSGAVGLGDYLESNGDGTARKQADDIMRASTIAKASQSIPQQSEENVIAVQLLIG